MFIPLPANIPWKAIGIAVAVLAVVAGILLYGDAKYDAGVEATDKAWIAAAKKLEAKSEGAADAADVPADKRAVVYAERLEAEKEKINEAVAKGDSPLDVLFGGGVRDDAGGNPAAP